MKLKTTIPLLKDNHNHFSLYAFLYGCPNLQDITDKSKAVKMINELDKHRVSVVLGWNSGYYSFTDEEMKTFPPVIIVNLSLHHFIVSKGAEEILKPLYPEIMTNYMNHKWYEDHFPGMLMFLASIPEPSEDKLGVFLEYMMQKGVYYVEDMLLPNEKVFRVIHQSQYASRTSFWSGLNLFMQLSPEVQRYIPGIKFFTDGALGAQTAAIGVPYNDGARGVLLYSDDQLYEMLEKTVSYDKAAAIHAIGENATAQVVRVAERVKSNGMKFPKLRMEHCQYIKEEDALKAKKLGIILSMQPNFTTDSVDYKDRLPQEYLETNNPFRMLIDKAGFVPGEDLIFGSDGMPHGVEYALKASLFPPYPGQKLSIEEFTAAYCMPDQTHGRIHIELDNAWVKCSVEYR